MLLVAAALPLLFWDAGPSTAPALRDAHIERIAVPAAQESAWKGVAGIAVQAADIDRLRKLAVPSVEYRPDQASASRAPWIQSNGWEFVRAPGAHFYYDAPGKAAGLAAAEAFSYGADALIHTDAAGLQYFAEMLAFLRGIERLDLPPLVDIAFQDDGGDTAGEVLNLMLRNNLLVRAAAAPDPKAKLNVRLGSAQFPLETAQDPAAMAHLVRSALGDDHRSIRIYGTQVVLARVTAGGGRLRLALLNYDGARRKVDGLHVRALGRFPKHTGAVAGGAAQIDDYSLDDQATEFTLPELKTFAVIDLSR